MARNRKSTYRSISLLGALLLWLTGATGVKGQANPLSVLDSNGIHIRMAAAQFELKPDLKANLKKIYAFLDEAAGWKDDQGIWRNKAFFIDEKGKIPAIYDKIQPTDHERKFFVDGDRPHRSHSCGGTAYLY